MAQYIIPNGEDVVMDQTIFDQDPDFFISWALGLLAKGRLVNNQGDRLVNVFDRDFIIAILNKKQPTFDDYTLLIKCCM